MKCSEINIFSGGCNCTEQSSKHSYYLQYDLLQQRGHKQDNVKQTVMPVKHQAGDEAEEHADGDETLLYSVRNMDQGINLFQQRMV